MSLVGRIDLSLQVKKDDANGEEEEEEEERKRDIRPFQNRNKINSNTVP